MSIRLIGLLSVLMVALPAPAEAAQAWLMFDKRVKLTEGQPAWPTEFRIFNQYRVGPDYGWFGQSLLRAGPVWDVANWLAFEAHLTAALDQEAPGSYEQELRAELEPTFKAAFGDLEVSDRNRLEHSWFPTETRWRYRNQLKLAYVPDDWSFKPFVSEEAFVVLGKGMSENRVQVGVSHEYAPDTRADLGYMWRAENEATGWQSAHVLTLTMFFGPVNPPLVGGQQAN
jgi:hypothetical protein